MCVYVFCMKPSWDLTDFAVNFSAIRMNVDDMKVLNAECETRKEKLHSDSHKSIRVSGAMIVL